MQPQKQEITKTDIELILKFQESPIYFIEKMWGLIPQPLKTEYRALAEISKLEDYKWYWFEKFEKGKHITWQQWLILLAVERAIAKTGKKRISIESGHGIGKSCDLAWLILWFLYCFKNAQIPCTAPTSDQMHDILWKEVKLWLDRMPKEIAAKFEWSNGYVRILESPETWFARAKTARKENPEALAGVHGEFVMFVIDEASGVPDEIFNVAEGALTGPNVLVIMISNHTRLIGYFHDSHNKDKASHQCFSFDSEESPIVDREFIERIRLKHGEDSDEWRVRVKGKAPKADAVDDAGYTPLFLESDLRKGGDIGWIGRRKLGVDPSGEGDDDSLWVGRDRFKAKALGKEKISNPLTVAAKTITYMSIHEISDSDTFYDNFGEGANVGTEVARAGRYIRGVNMKDKADDSEKFINKRAECYWRLKEWLRRGGELVGDGWDELLTIRYRATLGAGGKIQIMPKEEMRKRGIKSPNQADALALTFWEEDVYNNLEQENEEVFDRYAAI